MMKLYEAKYKPDYWRSDSKPEPKDFAVNPDPLHRVDPKTGTPDRAKIVEDISKSIKNWMANPRGCKFDDIINALKREWTSKGGSMALWEEMMAEAFNKSGYYKTMLRK